MENKLDAWELVWVVAEEEEAIVCIQMLAQQLHDCVNNHFNDIGLFDELSGLNRDRSEREAQWKTVLWCVTRRDALTTNSTYQCGHSEYLNRQSDDGYAPLMVIIYEVLLQLFKVLKRQRRHVLISTSCLIAVKLSLIPLFYLCKLKCKKPLELSLH